MGPEAYCSLIPREVSSSREIHFKVDFDLRQDSSIEVLETKAHAESFDQFLVFWSQNLKVTESLIERTWGDIECVQTVEEDMTFFVGLPKCS